MEDLFSFHDNTSSDINFLSAQKRVAFHGVDQRCAEIVSAQVEELLRLSWEDSLSDTLNAYVYGTDGDIHAVFTQNLDGTDKTLVEAAWLVSLFGSLFSSCHSLILVTFGLAGSSNAKVAFSISHKSVVAEVGVYGEDNQLMKTSSEAQAQTALDDSQQTQIVAQIAATIMTTRFSSESLYSAAEVMLDFLLSKFHHSEFFDSAYLERTYELATGMPNSYILPGILEV